MSDLYKTFRVDSFLKGKRVKQANMLNSNSQIFVGVTLDEVSINITILCTKDIDRLKQFIANIEPCFKDLDLKYKLTTPSDFIAPKDVVPYDDPVHRWYSQEEIKAKFKEFREHPERWIPDDLKDPIPRYDDTLKPNVDKSVEKEEEPRIGDFRQYTVCGHWVKEVFTKDGWMVDGRTGN